MNKRVYRNLLVTILALLGSGLGIAFSIKADIGVSAYDGFNTVLGSIFSIQVGTMMIICNTICVLIQLVILKREFSPRRLLQFIPVFSLGYIVNFVIYTWLSDVELTNYFMKLGLFIAGQVLCAFSIGILLAINYVSFSLEPAVMEVANVFGWNFAKSRQRLDLILIALNVLLAFIFQKDMVVREGTILGMLIYTPVMNIAFEWMKKKLLQEKGFID